MAGMLLIAWWILNRTSQHAPRASAAANAPAGVGAHVPGLSHAAPNTLGRAPAIAATVDELAKPWSSKAFTFADPVTHAAIPAMIIRLPGAGKSSSMYWAFSLNVPYESCQLQFVTDAKELAAAYLYPARHPMLAASCNGTVYDPLKLGTAPTGAWVRGEVVHGTGIRPPLSIEVRVQGRSIIATRME